MSTPEHRGAAIEARGLRKSYGALEAVRGVDLSVAHGEVFALLGPNGAGKTTTVEILEGHRVRSAGEVRVLGHDPASGERAFKERVGIVLQSAGVDPSVRRGDAQPVSRLLPAPAAAGRPAGRRRSAREAPRTRAPSLRRPAAAPRRGRRPGGRPGVALPGRADDGVRPVGAARGVGDGGGTEGARQDHPAHHPLHGGGRAPRRPRGHYEPGHHRRRGQAFRVNAAPGRDDGALPRGRRERPPRPATLPPRRMAQAARIRSRRTSRRATCIRLTAWAVEQGVELEELSVSRPSLDDVFIDLTGRSAAEEAQA